VSEAAALDRLDLIAQGKVRDIYAIGEDRLLLVTTDRISTYDVVHPNPIPDKGKVLTGLSTFWFERTTEVCPNHLISYTDVPEEVRGRAFPGPQHAYGIAPEELERLKSAVSGRGSLAW